MAPSLALPEPGPVLDAVAKEEASLRRSYLRVNSAEYAPDDPRPAIEMLERSAALLELVAVSVCILEVSKERGAPALAPSSQDATRYYGTRISQSCGLNVEEVVARAVKTLGIGNIKRQTTQSPSLDAVLRATRSLLEICPIEHLERLSAAFGMEAVGHRCRIAYEALRSFVLRNDERAQSRLKLVGRAYAQGGLSPDDVAVLLDTTVPDAIALLERYGYQRSIDSIALADADRTALLVAIREDRLKRRGRPQFSRDLAVRDTIASERIEGVDARSWLLRDLM